MANQGLQTSQKGLEFIAKWESMVLHPYLDSAQKWTIGIGKLLVPTDSFINISNSDIRELLKSTDPNHRVTKKKITKAEALKCLKEDVKECEEAIKNNVTVPLTQTQFDVLVSWTFNCGIGSLKSSTLLKKLNKKEYNEVANELLKWANVTISGKKVPSQGLLNRRIAEAQLWLDTGC